MRLSRYFIGLTLLPFLAGLVGCQPSLKLPPLGHAPAWKFTGLDGKEVSSAQFQGKIVVLDFWATWCQPCIEEIPGYIKLQEKYGKDGVVIVGVSLDEAGADVVKPFVQKKGMNYRVAVGKIDEAEAIFGTFAAIPTTFLIDRTGEIRDRKTGPNPVEEYEQKLKAVLN